MIRQDWSTLRKLMFAKTAAAGAAVTEATATGNPLTFLTDLARPLKSLLIPFSPVQSGTGDPSPQNIRSILPWNGLKVKQGGKNLVSLTIGETKSINGIDYVVLSDGGVNCEGIANGSSYGIESKKTTLPSGKYTFSVTGATNAHTVIVKNNAYYREINGVGSTTFTLTEETVIHFYIMFSSGAVADETVYVQIEAGQTATAYEPYTPITETDISFPSHVYGGTLDVVSGVLTVEYALLTKNTANMNNNEDYPGWKNSGVENIIGTGVNELLRNVLTNVSPVSSLTVGANTAYGSDVLYLNKSFFNKTQSEWIALAIDVQILVPLATPQEITLTPEQITALVGDNTIWSDADGSLTATYLKKG